MAISHVSDNIVVGEQDDFSTVAADFNEIAGYVESFSYNEVENLDKFASVGSGAKYSNIEEQLYYVEGTLTTKATKSSLGFMIKAVLGNYEVTDGKYSAEVDTGSKSYWTIKAQHNDTQVAVITGVVFTNFQFEVSVDGYLVLTADYIAQKCDIETEVIDGTVPEDDVYVWLDCKGQVGSDNFVANTFSISGDWNVDATEGRGIQTAGTGERRLLKDVIRHRCNVSGSVDYRVNGDLDVFGYADNVTAQDVVLTASRGADNEHTFTLEKCKLDNKEQEVNNEDSIKEGSFDIEGLNIKITGDVENE